MVKRKYCSIILAIVAMVCFAVGFLTINYNQSFANNNSVFLQKQTNYQLTENYQIKDLKGFGETPFYNNGLLFSTSNEGAQYTIADGCEKNFSFVALPVASSLASIDLSDANAVKGVTADFSQLSIIFNGADGDVLTVKLLGAKGYGNIANEQIKYSVEFNGKDLGVSGNITQSFRTVSNGAIKPIYFHADTVKEFIAFDVNGEYSQQKIDLSNVAGLDLVNYSVDIKIEGLISTDQEAKLVLLELCGQALNGETVKPVIKQDIVSNGIVNANYKLPSVYAFDIVNCKNLSNKVTYDVTKNGVAVPVANGAFKPEQAGDYKITATLMDGENTLNVEERVIKVFTYKPQVEFDLSEEIVEDCKIYDTIKIPSATVSSELFLEEVSVDVSVIVAGKVICRVEDVKESFNLKFEKHGIATVIYSVIDYFGYVTNYESQVTVENIPNLQNVSLPVQFSLNKSYSLPSPTMVFNGVNCKVYTEVLTPSGKVYDDVQGFIDIEELGVYTITYYTLIEGVQHTYEYSVESVLTSESIIEEVNDIALIQANCDLPEYSLSGNGVKILGSTTGASFTFNNVIDLTEFTREDTIISLQVLNANELSTFNKVIVTLTDVNDLSNKISVRLFRNNSGAGSDQWSYVTAKYKAGYAGVSNNGSSVGVVQRVEWGGTVNWCSFNGLKYSNCAEFAFSLDYESKCIYTATGPQGASNDLVLDLDDINHVGVGNEWKGFSEGKAYLTVTMEGLTSTGGIIVTKVANNDLNGDHIIDDVCPKIYLSTDKDFATLPVGEIGTKYSLPSLLAWDMIDQDLQTEITLYKGSKTNKINFDEDDLTFVPTEIGTYSIEYKAIDDAGNVATKLVSFEVVSELSELGAVFTSTPANAKIGDLYTIPEIEIVGGSSICSFVEKVLYNGLEIEISTNRTVRLEQSGELQVVVEVVDYLGNEYNSIFDEQSGLIIEILSADMPIIEVQNVPTVVYKGETLILPEYQVFNANKEQSNEISKKVEVNGMVVTDTMKYLVTEQAGTVLTVKYYAIGQETNVQAFEVLVIDPLYVSDYLAIQNADATFTNNMQGVQVNLTKEYLEYVFTESKRIVFPQNLVSDSLNIKISINPLYSDFDYFDVYLKDSFDQDNVVFFRVCKDGYLEVNGDTSNRIAINGSFTTENSYFYFIYNNYTKELLSEDGTLITGVDKNILGFKFNGFSKSLVNLSIVMPDCNENGSSSIRIMQIANQTFMSTFSGGKLSMYNDRTGPLVRFESKMENKTILKGEDIFISSASAHDVFRSTSDISVTLSFVAEENQVIYTGDCLQDYVYTPTKCGTYEISYLAKDSKKRDSKITFYIVVKEIDAPVIETSTNVKSQYSINDTINYIKATVTDESSARYYMIVVQPDGKRVVVKEKDNYKFTVEGGYKILLYAEDEYFNLSKVEYSVTVKG